MNDEKDITDLVEAEIIRESRPDWKEQKLEESKAVGRAKKQEIKEKKQKAKSNRQKNMAVQREKAQEKKGFKLNVSKLCEELDFNPVEALIEIGRFNKKALGIEEDISVFNARLANQELLKYVAAPYKPRDFVDEEEAIPMIPEFVPKRGNPTPKLLEEDDD